MLNDMMKHLSKDAGLSTIYTNHSVRATTVDLLAHSGVPDREIMHITGHKCGASLSSYNADSSNNQKWRTSAILQGVDFNESDVNNTVTTLSTTTGRPRPATVSSSPSVSCIGPVGAGNVNYLHQINNLRLPVTPSYNRQCEISNSTVNIYNYSIKNPSD